MTAEELNNNIGALVARLARYERADGDIYKLGDLLAKYKEVTGRYHSFTSCYPEFVTSLETST